MAEIENSYEFKIPMKQIYYHCHTWNFSHHKPDKNHSNPSRHFTLLQSIQHPDKRNKMHSTTTPHTSKHTETSELHTSNEKHYIIESHTTFNQHIGRISTVSHHSSTWNK